MVTASRAGARRRIAQRAWVLVVLGRGLWVCSGACSALLGLLKWTGLDWAGLDSVFVMFFGLRGYAVTVDNNALRRALFFFLSLFSSSFVFPFAAGVRLLPSCRGASNNATTCMPF